MALLARLEVVEECVELAVVAGVVDDVGVKLADGDAGVVLVAGLADGLVVEEGVGGQHVDVLQPGHDVAHRLVGVSCESCLWPNHISKSLILPSSPLQRHFKSNIEFW